MLEIKHRIQENWIIDIVYDTKDSDWLKKKI